MQFVATSYLFGGIMGRLSIGMGSVAMVKSNLFVIERLLVNAVSKLSTIKS